MRDQFEQLLRQWDVKDPEAIAEFVATYGENAFEDPSKKCDVCGKSFTTAQALAGHRRLAHRVAKGQPSAQHSVPSTHPEGAPSEPVPAATQHSVPSTQPSTTQETGQPSARAQGATPMTPLDTQQQFQELLTKLAVEKHAAIAEFMAAQDAFESPIRMARVLAVANIKPHQRRAVMEHWLTIVDERQNS